MVPQMMGRWWKSSRLWLCNGVFLEYGIVNPFVILHHSSSQLWILHPTQRDLGGSHLLVGFICTSIPCATLLKRSHASIVFHAFLHFVSVPICPVLIWAWAWAHVSFTHMSLSSWVVLTFLGVYLHLQPTVLAVLRCPVLVWAWAHGGFWVCDLFGVYLHP